MVPLRRNRTKEFLLRQFTFTFVCLIFLSVASKVENAAAQSQAPVRADSVGLQRTAATGALNLTVQQAVQIALENNPSLKVERIRVEQAKSRIEGQKGEFNPLFNSSSIVSHKDNIVASRFYPTGLYVDMQKSQVLSVEKRIRAGTRFTAGLNYADLRSTSNTQTLSPQFSANLSLGFSQPLMRDFGRYANEYRLRIAEKGAAVAENTLYTRISQLIQRVEETYWNFTFILKDVEGKQRSLDNAREFLAQNENLLRAGRVASVAVLQARAAVAERERDLITSQTAADQFEDRLKSLLWLDLNATDLSVADQGQPTTTNIDLQRSLEGALQRRPEIRALQRESEQRDLEVGYAANQMKPRLDLNAQFTAAGLSGKPNATCLDPTSTLCIPVGGSVAGSILETRTGVRDAFTPLLSTNPFESWSVELKFQLPIGNQSAKAQYEESTLRRLETGTNLEAMRDQINIEVRDAVREAQAAQKRIDASREAVTYVEDQLAGMRRQLEAGLVSSYDVLKSFDEVDKARTTELQATMDYNVALSKIRLADASTFQQYNIELTGVRRYGNGE
jgi:outer membrane protein TolC